MSYQFYCLSFDNKYKKQKMEEKFDKLDINCNFYNGVSHTDKRIKYAGSAFCKRQWSITYGHLDIIYDFWHYSDKDYAIICEDDIMIHKNIKQILNKIIEDLSSEDLDILLLGYMLPYKIIDTNGLTRNYKFKKMINESSIYTYHEYPDYHSGTQMYMITKNYAKRIIQKYYNNYYSLLDRQFILDKLFIKDGNRALIYPMLAIEDDNQDDKYHQLCHKIHFKEFYI